MMAAGADLAWGGACAACGRPGPVLCPDCARTLHELLPFEVPGRAGVPVTVARGDYADDVRRVILACKERQGLTLVPVLAELADQNDEEFFGKLPRQLREDLLEAMKEVARTHQLKSAPLN